MANTTAFYPKSGDIKKYTYLTSLFIDENNDFKGAQGSEQRTTGELASQELLSARTKFSMPDIQGKAWSNLQGLVQRERSAEQQFLAQHLRGITIEQIRQYGIKELVDSINRLLSFYDTYRTNLENVKSMSTGETRAGYSDQIQWFLKSNLPKIIKDYFSEQFSQLTPEEVNKLTSGQYDSKIISELGQRIRNEFNRVYNPNTSNGQDYQQFTELINRLFSENNQLITQILQGYGISASQMQTRYNSLIKSQKVKKDSKIDGTMLTATHQGGQVFEVFTETLFKELTKSFGGTSIHTGSFHNMKADHIITFDTSGLETVLNDAVKNAWENTADPSTRIRNIQAIENFFKDIAGVPTGIVMVSDKSYNLGTDFFARNKGFTAEQPSLSVLEGVLTRAGEDDIEDLIFVLANTGSQRFIDGADYVERYLATKIGNFVFDDVVISQELGKMGTANVIHVFNLGGIYVPLSVLLEGVLQALQALNNDYQDFVYVKFHASSIKYEKQTDGLTEEDWSKMRSDVEAKSSVSFHFFGNFIEFVSRYLY